MDALFLLAGLIIGWGQEKDRRRSRAAGIEHHLIKTPELAKLKDLLLEWDGMTKPPSKLP